MPSETKHEVEIIKNEEDYSLSCICSWKKEDIPKRPLAKAIAERHMLVNRIWPYPDEEEHPDWLK